VLGQPAPWNVAQEQYRTALRLQDTGDGRRGPPLISKEEASGNR
jgi:hypothetical protein